MDRWEINRAGVINFWYYDDEVFEFEDGRLLLRGANGSGKSVTMQSLIPLLFDGNKSPERLDPFGSRARKMDSYLLSEGLDLDERTGYLFLEFYKKGSKRYKTIGMGMRARKNMTTQTWYFILNDNRRIGHDHELSLYKDIGDKIPLTQKELENRIGDGGQLFTKQKEYKAAVNEHLFGYSDLTDFEELIELLIQIRSPKLSKEFKPTTMYEIMQNSLFTLTEEDLRPLSEAIENMDSVKEKIDGLLVSKKSIDKIASVYDKYNEYLLAYKAKAYLSSKQEVEKENRKQKKLETQITELTLALKENNLSINALDEEEVQLRLKENQLKENDISKLVETKLELIKNSKELTEDIEKKHQLLDKLKSEAIDLEKRKSDYDQQNEGYQIEISHISKELEDLSKSAEYDECNFMLSEYEKDPSSIKFDYYKTHLKSYSQKVKIGLEAILNYERVAEKYDEILKTKDDKQKSYESQGKKVLDYQRQLEEIKEEFVEKAMVWYHSNQVLAFDKSIMTKVAERVFQYGEIYDFQAIKEHLDQVYRDYSNQKNAEISALEGKKNNVLEAIQEKEALINDLKNQKEVEPKRSQAVLKNRARLKEENIPFLPLYQALDFQKDLDETLKNNFEEALLNLGLLDALVIDPKHKEHVLKFQKGYADQYIFSKPNLLSHNLSTYLKAEKDVEINPGLINDVIQSIFLDQNSTLFVLENGHIGHGILEGKISGDYQSKYISYFSRKRYKENQITSIETEIVVLKSHVRVFEEKIKSYVNLLAVAEIEYMAFPDKADLETAYMDLQDHQRLLKTLKIQFDDLLIAVEASYESFNVSKRIRHEKTQNIYLTLSVDVYKEALTDLDDYRDLLYEMIQIHVKISHVSDRIEAVCHGLEQNIENQDNFLYDLSKWEFQYRSNQNKLDTIDEQLKASDYEDFMKALKSIKSRLDLIPNERKARYASQNTLQTQHNKINELLSSGQGLLENFIKRVELYKWAYTSEENLNFTSLILDDMDLDESCKAVVNAYGSLLDEIRTVTQLKEQVYKRFHEEQSDLVDYNMKMTNLFENKPVEEVSETDRMYIERVDITARVQGKTVKFFEMVKVIQDQIDVNQNLLDEQDRELFEEILINSISRKISGKIYHSEKWVKEIDLLMSHMNTSSGLKFNLKWTTKNAAQEDQMGTRELVQILKGDQSLLTQSQREGLIQHFRSKIKESKLRLGTDDKRSFLGIMKDVLDYRKWFEFQLYYTKTGENKKELTNNAFFTFSGGEKAMAMYVPLFSAVYAKYQSGAKDCPKVISLDEAFAGVDEKNIKDMFKLLVELELSFVANSQVLFGDYDSVPSLGIYELIRPENVTFVTLIRYKWDGFIRSMVTDDV